MNEGIKNKGKFSKYNNLLQYNGNYYLYNSKTCGLGKLNDNQTTNFNNYITKPDECLKNIVNDDDLVEKMIKGGMLIHADLNELEQIRFFHYKGRFGRTNTLALTIAPTMACNFRCVYCYEKDNKYPPVSMSREVMDKLIEYVINNLNEEGNLTINWYGGEPLLELEKIKELQTSFKKIVAEKNAKIRSAMVTNGYLLTKEVSDELQRLGITTFQITLDGDESFHNSRRPLINGNNTYRKIIDNILSIDENIRVSLRINIDKSNIDSIGSFLDTLSYLGIKDKKNISLYYSLVRDTKNVCQSFISDCYTVQEYALEETKLYKLTLDKGFKLSRVPRPYISNCGAVGPNVFVIEPDGGIQKCWNAIGDKDKRVGHLLYNDDVHVVNNIKWLGWDPLNKEKCADCNILPMCMGGCPYFSIYGDPTHIDYSCNPYLFNMPDMLELLIKEKEQYLPKEEINAI